MRFLSKAYILALLATLCTFATSCSDEEGNYILSASSIKVRSTHLQLKAMADTAMVEIASDGALSARSASEWLSTIVSGNKVYACAVQNDSLYARAARLVVYQGSDSVAFTVQQNGIKYSSEYNTDGYNLNNEASHFAFYINHNVDVVINDLPQWIKATVVADSVVVDVDANTTGFSRSAYLKYSVGELSDSVLINQESGVVFMVEKNQVSIDMNGGTDEVTFMSNFDVTIGTLPDWLTVSIDDDVITFSADKNDANAVREVDVVLNAGEVTQIISVKHEFGLTFNLAKNNIALTDGVLYASIALKHNATVDVADVPEWLNVEISTDSVKITALADYNAGIKREAQIKLSSSLGEQSVSETISVTQYFNIIGSYYLYFYNAADIDNEETKRYRIPSVLLKEDDSYYLYVPNMEWYFSLEYDEQTATISLNTFEEIGEMDYEGTTLTLVSTIGTIDKMGIKASYNATFDFDGEQLQAPFISDNQDVIRLLIVAFDGDEYIGNVQNMYHPYLQKIVE